MSIKHFNTIGNLHWPKCSTDKSVSLKYMVMCHWYSKTQPKNVSFYYYQHYCYEQWSSYEKFVLILHALRKKEIMFLRFIFTICAANDCVCAVRCEFDNSILTFISDLIWLGKKIGCFKRCLVSFAFEYCVRMISYSPTISYGQCQRSIKSCLMTVTK